MVMDRNFFDHNLDFERGLELDLGLACSLRSSRRRGGMGGFFWGWGAGGFGVSMRLVSLRCSLVFYWRRG